MKEIPGFKSTKKLEDAIQGTTDFETMRQLLHEEADAQGVTLAHSWEENPQSVNTARFSRDCDPQQQERDAHGRFVAEGVEQKPQGSFITHVEKIPVPGAPGTARDVTFTGTSLDDINKQVLQAYRFLEQTPTNAEELAWARATEEFLHSPDGLTWAGGGNNRNAVANMLAALGLVNAQDKLAAIQQACAVLKANGMIALPNASLSESQKRDMEELGGRSAEQAARFAAEEAAANGASPAEILEAWKSSLQSNGVDPNDSFVRTRSDTYSTIKRTNPYDSSLFGK